MKESLKILVSKTIIRTNDIGSWTKRLNCFLDNNPAFFDVVLSPDPQGLDVIYCKKRKFITWKKQLRKFQLLNWVAADYLIQIKRLSKIHDKLVIVVMDEPHLLEAIALIKDKLKCKAELIFSFHGFDLNIKKEAINNVDKILFLSQTGLERSRRNYQNFPKAIVVGNAVNSKMFYPLDKAEFQKLRQKFGYKISDEIILWVANDKPRKGFHIFSKIVNHLLLTNNNLKFIIIGTSKIVKNRRVTNLGKIKNNEVAKYMQISNYFLFTTTTVEGFGLTMIEAYKSGNVVIASNKPASPEVLNGLKHTYLVNDIENIDSWIETFNLARTNSNFGKDRPSKANTDNIWNYEDWEQKFLNAIC